MPIATIPESISLLENLEDLDGLMECCWTDLPASIAGLQYLRGLRLDGNRFSRIPDAVYQLTSLQWLGIETRARR